MRQYNGRIIPHLPTSPPHAGMMRERMKEYYCPVVMLRAVRVVWKHFPINCFFANVTEGHWDEAGCLDHA